MPHAPQHAAREDPMPVERFLVQPAADDVRARTFSTPLRAMDVPCAFTPLSINNKKS